LGVQVVAAEESVKNVDCSVIAGLFGVGSNGGRIYKYA
jgi:hypothetical protein